MASKLLKTPLLLHHAHTTMQKEHFYEAKIQWTGNLGKGTSAYTSYKRDYAVIIDNKKVISCSSDPAFRGDHTKHNPEDLFISSISSCHMLWYLHLCSANDVIVEEYIDYATGTMLQTEKGNGYFTEVVLNPHVVVKNAGMIEVANQLHQSANEMCFIAQSLNFPVRHRPITKSSQ